MISANTEYEFPARSRFPLGFLSNLRIRHLLLMVVSALSLIAVLSLTWNASLVVMRYNGADQLAESNEFVIYAIALTTVMVRERGLTASLLANSAQLNEENRRFLNDLRSKTDQGLSLMHWRLDQHLNLPSRDSIERHLDLLGIRLAESRAQADATWAGQLPVLSAEQWMAQITQNVEALRRITREALAPVREEEHAMRYGVLMKELFFNLSENAGRERALIGMAIAQARTFTEAEYRILENLRYINLNLLSQIDEILRFFPQLPEILEASAGLKIRYQGDYEKLRGDLITKSLLGQSYGVSVAQWFQEATDAVNSIQYLSYAINQHISEDFHFIKEQSRNRVIALILVMLLVLAVFMLSLLLTFRRILAPLMELEMSAKTIARGDFSREIIARTADEFGDVVQAFEVMRTYLLHDRKKRQEAEVELNKLHMAIEQNLSSVIITDAQGVTQYVNPQFEKASGYQSAEVIGKKFNLLKSGRTPASTYEELWQTIKGGKVWTGELLNKRKDGQHFWEFVSISPVKDEQGEIAHFVSIQHDITEQVALEQRLDFIARHDELTALPNRTLLVDRFEQLTAHASRAQSQVALLVVDLDRFKRINDSIGHRIGDQLLIEVADRLKRSVRSCDTVARYGSDEFVILAEDITNIETLVELVQRLMQSFEPPFHVESYELHLSASVGISIWPTDGADIDTLLRKSDTAMHHAKALGSHQFQFFTEAMNAQVSQRMQLENELLKAIEKEQLTLHYQPQVCLVTGRVLGAEALLRWQHPEMGAVSPLQIISLAEESGLIKPLGLWVLRSACQEACRWRSQTDSEDSVAVNVSVCQLEDDQFVAGVAEILAETGLAPHRLEIEITESSVMVDPDKMLSVLKRIKNLGVQLALDDFGTGYSSLSYLRQFPFDKLKIDRSFVREVTEKQEDVAIAEAIATMAKTLGMKVLAEGVETPLQAEYMRRCGCDEIQGFLVSKAVAPEELAQLRTQTYALF